MPLLLNACPSFQNTWHSGTIKDEDLLYVSLGKFAGHLLKLQQENKTQEFKAVGEVIERFHLEGDPFVKESATIGILESIQNIWRNNGVGPELFFRFLLPESAKWWRSLNNFWNGKVKYVGEGL